MSYLEGKRVYLSGAIEHDHSNLNWREYPKKVLIEEFKVNLFDPFADPKQQWVPQIQAIKEETKRLWEAGLKKEAKEHFKNQPPIVRNFVRKDLKQVEKSDFLIVYLPKEVPTTGTHKEIDLSWNNKNPTLFMCPTGFWDVSVWYTGYINTDYMFGSWDDLFDYLRAVDRGEHKDDFRWSFVYGLI